jgi:hypothetical protein
VPIWIEILPKNFEIEPLGFTTSSSLFGLMIGEVKVTLDSFTTVRSLAAGMAIDSK